MNKKVIIYDGASNEKELAEILRDIASLIDQGKRSGTMPSWEIVEDEDE